MTTHRWGACGCKFNPIFFLTSISLLKLHRRDQSSLWLSFPFGTISHRRAPIEFSLSSFLVLFLLSHPCLCFLSRAAKVLKASFKTEAPGMAPATEPILAPPTVPGRGPMSRVKRMLEGNTTTTAATSKATTNDNEIQDSWATDPILKGAKRLTTRAWSWT